MSLVDDGQCGQALLASPMSPPPATARGAAAGSAAPTSSSSSSGASTRKEEEAAEKQQQFDELLDWLDEIDAEQAQPSGSGVNKAIAQVSTLSLALPVHLAVILCLPHSLRWRLLAAWLILPRSRWLGCDKSSAFG